MRHPHGHGTSPKFMKYGGNIAVNMHVEKAIYKYESIETISQCYFKLTFDYYGLT